MGPELALDRLAVAEESLGIAHGPGAYRETIGPAPQDARNPEGALAEASTLSGFSIPFIVGPGTQLRSRGAVGRGRRLCDPKITAVPGFAATRRSLQPEPLSPFPRRPSPSPERRCKPFGLLAVSSLDDPEGSPLGLATGPSPPVSR
jgi:hypothetical protein